MMRAPTFRGPSPFRRWIGAVVVLVLVTATLVTLVTVSAGVATVAVLEAAPDLPDPGVDVSAIDDLDAAVNRNRSQASVVVDADGQLLGRFAPEETHLPFEVGGVPETIETVLLAAEDEHFRDHGGFAPTAIARALVRNVRGGDVEQGGSTLTQQLAKNLYTGNAPSLDRKLQELQIAIDLERRFTKDEILTAYANSVFLGNGAFGFEAAARTYFAKPAADLTLSEAASSSAVLPAPTARDPRADSASADRARRHVLERARAVGAASPDVEIDAAVAEVPAIQPSRPIAERFPYYLDYVRRHLLEEQGMDPEVLYGGGLRIETGLDPSIQAAAVQAVAHHLPDPDGPAAAVAVVDVTTGLVAAVVGGRDFDASAVNLALGARGGGAGRQAGSSFKPFVLATAFEAGYAPDQEIEAPAEYLPVTVDDPKPVQNFSHRGYGTVSLATATVNSINTAFVSLTEVVGAAAVRQTATRLGVRGLPEHPGPSIGIGAYETSPLAMAERVRRFRRRRSPCRRQPRHPHHGTRRRDRGRPHAAAKRCPNPRRQLPDGTTGQRGAGAERAARHRDPGPARPSGRSQDGNIRRVRQRLAGRPHPGLRRGSLGRPPRRQHPHARRGRIRHRDGRQPAGPDLARRDDRGPCRTPGAGVHPGRGRPRGPPCAARRDHHDPALHVAPRPCHHDVLAAHHRPTDDHSTDHHPTDHHSTGSGDDPPAADHHDHHGRHRPRPPPGRPRPGRPRRRLLRRRPPRPPRNRPPRPPSRPAPRHRRRPDREAGAKIGP